MTQESLFETLDLSPKNEEDRTETFVRLSRSWWHDKNGAYMRISLKYLKRRCKGYNIFDDDCSNIGAEDAISKIENLYECDDGIYELVFIGHTPDYWTGHVEDWDYELRAVKEESKIPTKIAT